MERRNATSRNAVLSNGLAGDMWNLPENPRRKVVYPLVAIPVKRSLGFVRYCKPAWIGMHMERSHGREGKARALASGAKRWLHFTLPSGNSPICSNRWAKDAVSLRKSPACRLSLGEWALDSGSSMPSKRAGGPPNNSAKGPTKPIEPPQPIATGFTPKPFLSALEAAVNAGPVGSVIHHLSCAVGVTSTLTFHGGSLVSTALI